MPFMPCSRSAHECRARVRARARSPLTAHWPVCVALCRARRLRKAIRHAVASSRDAEHNMSSKLNDDMLTKFMSTRGLKEDLERQLDRIK